MQTLWGDNLSAGQALFFRRRNAKELLISCTIIYACIESDYISHGNRVRIMGAGTGTSKTKRDSEERSDAVEAARAETALPPVRSAGENVDKIREILFGVQMREYEKRFNQLETRLFKHVADLRDETVRRLDALESFTKHEIEAINDSLRAERDARGEKESSLDRELSSLSANTEKRVRQLEDQLAKTAREIREQILVQGRANSEETRTKIDSLSAIVDRRSSILQEEKVDRADMASVLTELAIRLNKGSVLSELEIPSDVSSEH